MIGIDDAVSNLSSLIKTGIDKIWPNPNDEAAAKIGLIKAQAESIVTQLQATQAVMLAEAQSADPWTSRARPTFLYVMYSILILCFIGGILGIWFPLETKQAAENINALLRALPNELYMLFGMGYLGYTGARTFEKFGRKK